MNRVVLLFLFLGVFAGTVPAIAGYENIILTDMDGNEVKVDSLLAEGPVVLNFWATWCRPCRIEMPHIEKIYADLASRKVHFAAISLDARNRRTQLEKYIVTNEVKLPVYVDPQGAVSKLFKVAAIPTTILLDGKGEINFRTKGYRPGDEVLLKKKIEALLPAEKAEANPEKAAPETAEANPEKADAAPEAASEEEAPGDEAVPSDAGE